MPKKKLKSRMPLVTFLILIALSIMAYAITTITSMIEKSDYVAADVLEVSGSTVIVGKNCTAIVADTSPERAYSIEIGKKGIIEERPTVYDVFAETLKSFNITLDSIQIERFDGQNYYSYLVLVFGDKILRLDTRPSDAINLALRTNSTIYIKKSLLNEAGKNIC